MIAEVPVGSPVVSGQRTAVVAGTGLIGGSVGMALRRAGWRVVGVEPDPERAAAAVAAGAVDLIGEPLPCDLAVVATPVEVLAEVAGRLLESGAAVVTDVGSVKAPVAAAVSDPRFVAGHPMAGNELEGVAGASADLFRGAVWVLTPTPHTDDRTLATVSGIVSGMGARVIVLTPERHDALVAVVSHVPHLTAATLTRLAHRRSSEHRAVLRLAAGGFRDMTRIAAGHPAIWPDICSANRAAIVGSLDELIAELAELRRIVSDGEQAELLSRLEAARQTRLGLPTTAPEPSQLTELRVPVPDEKGQLAKITTLASDLDVNIYDIHIVHSPEGPQGTVMLLVDDSAATRLRDSLVALGYRPLLASLDWQ